MLDEHEEEVEGDLSEYFGIRYTDRWRFDADGRRRLTLREILVRLQFLPPGARVVRHYNGGRARWTDEEILLSDVFHALTGKPHPARPAPPTKAVSPEREKLRRRRVREKHARQAARMEAQRKAATAERD